MKKNHEQEAIDLCMYWEKGFNERNRDICIEAMHFPHVRLWENTFSIFYVAEDFLKGFDKQTADLEKEGWGKTITLDIKAIQSSDDKVHGCDKAKIQFSLNLLCWRSNPSCHASKFGSRKCHYLCF